MPNRLPSARTKANNSTIAQMHVLQAGHIANAHFSGSFYFTICKCPHLITLNSAFLINECSASL